MKKLLFVPLPGLLRHWCIEQWQNGNLLTFLLVVFMVVSTNTDLIAQTTYLPNYLLKSHNTTAEYVNCQVFDDGNNVGINTATPGEKLDVAGGNIRTTGSFISLTPSGTPPMTVSSASLVSNLNSDLLDGMHASAFSTTSHGHSNMLTGAGITSQVAFWSAGGVLTGDDAFFWDFSTNKTRDRNGCA